MTSDTEIQQAADEHYQSRFGEIKRLIRLENECDERGHFDWSEAIRERLNEMALCVECVTIYPQRKECEWEILLGTGGPADRVLVTTDFDGEVDSATYQHQDWFTLWTDAHGQDSELVEAFAQNFYFSPVSNVVGSL